MEQKEDKVPLVNEVPLAKLEHQVHQEHLVYLVKMYASATNICFVKINVSYLG